MSPGTPNLVPFSAFLSGPRNHSIALIAALCASLFFQLPESSLAAGQVAADQAGYIIAGEDTKTSVPGVFAAGDVRTKAVRQIITAAADGAVAVHFAEEYLNEK